MTERWTGKSRMSVLVSVALTTAVVGIVVSCGDPQPAATSAGGVQGQTSCATPQTGCACTPGSVAACGKRVDGDLNFIYCYEGTRRCGPNGLYGECMEGTVVAQSLASSSLHTTALGTPGPCSSVDTGPLKVCTSGRKQGEYCASALDCSGGVKKCLGGPNDGASCKKEKDCPDPGDCTSFAGTCSGGARNGFGCNVLADCPGAVACAPAGGGGVCGTFSGICDNGTEDGEACNADADCLGGGQCKSDKRGHCQGGKENEKKCRHNKHCQGGASCSAEDPGTPGIIDPCDPYCNVTADSVTGLTPPAGFAIVNNGLTPIAGIVCGDSVVSPPENCDDGNTTAGDGCSATCKIEAGFQCVVPGMPCTPSTCGNGIVEGIEQCDDGPWAADATGVVKDRPYDGCYKCQRDFNCPSPAGVTAQPCVAVCGDGLLFPGEACDDGNTTNGDGCSSTCTVEAGASCMAVTAASPATIDVPIIYRDFLGGVAPYAPPIHPDFQGGPGNPGVSPPHLSPLSGLPCVGGAALCVGGQRRGIASLGLAPDKEPTLATTQNLVKDAASFLQWFHDDPTFVNNKVILGKSIRLAKNMAGAYVFDSAADVAYGLANINCGNASTCAAKTGFYPIDALGYGNYGPAHNYHFTSELRYPFTYKGGEVLSFSGDDDVFVYVGGRKVVDLGGIHGVENGSVTLNAATGTIPVSSAIGLVVGQTYEISVFQTERNTTGSNYKLTLSNFTNSISSCTVPVPPRTYVRDFEGVCPVGNRVVWQLFRWKAGVPAGAQIDFRAATADTVAALPASPAPAAPASVPIGTATNMNSPSAGPIVFVNDTAAGLPVPVSKHLQVEGMGTVSKQWLRVYMNFTGTPTLFEWQQLFDCVPAE